MRVKVRSMEDYVEVVDSATGELLSGVSRLSMYADKEGNRNLTLTMVDFDVDLDAVATLQDADGLIVGSKPCGDDCACRPSRKQRSS